jgi:shikimate 5-dehydrogenase
MTTGKSSIMNVFPVWARYLGITEGIQGIDCKWHDDPDVYLRVVDFLKQDPLALGALVTTHKLDLLKASRARFDWLDPYATQLEEVSCISKRDGKLRGHAKDPISSGLSIEAIRPSTYWGGTSAEVCILGAGGSSLALTIYLQQQSAGRRPSTIHVTNRSEKRLLEMKAVHAKMNCPVPLEYYLCPTPAENDAVVARLKEGSMVINATGLGKDAPGSPLTDAVEFPGNGIAWEFNYRGELVFLDQARAQEEARGLSVHDGWVYFVHGWLSVIREVFNLDIPSSGPEFDALCKIAAAARKP